MTKEEEAILSAYNENSLTQDDLKDKLPVLREQKLRGALIRSKAQLAKEEQKPTNFFLYLGNTPMCLKVLENLKLIIKKL